MTSPANNITDTPNQSQSHDHSIFALLIQEAFACLTRSEIYEVAIVHEGKKTCQTILQRRQPSSDDDRDSKLFKVWRSGLYYESFKPSLYKPGDMINFLFKAGRRRIHIHFEVIQKNTKYLLKQYDETSMDQTAVIPLNALASLIVVVAVLNPKAGLEIPQKTLLYK